MPADSCEICQQPECADPGTGVCTECAEFSPIIRQRYPDGNIVVIDQDGAWTYHPDDLF